MGVAAEVPQDGGRAPEGGLGVHHPVGLEEGIDEGPPRVCGAQVLAPARKVEFAAVVGLPQRLDKLPAKDSTEDFHG